MKKLFPVFLALCLLLAPMAGNVSADDHELLPAAQVTQIPVDPAAGMALELTQAEQPPIFQPGTVPADSAPLDAIALPLHALVLSMVERELTYNVQSDLFVWNALYYTLSMYGQLDDRTAQTDDALLFPSELVQDYLFALFSDHDGLPCVPEQLADRISYDPSTDHYRLALGDFGLTQLHLDPPIAGPEGILVVNGTLLSPADGTLLCAFRVTLLEADNMFGFTVLNLIFP